MFRVICEAQEQPRVDPFSIRLVGSVGFSFVVFDTFCLFPCLIFLRGSNQLAVT
jgi:hypothetical protein